MHRSINLRKAADLLTKSDCISRCMPGIASFAARRWQSPCWSRVKNSASED